MASDNAAARNAAGQPPAPRRPRRGAMAWVIACLVLAAGGAYPVQAGIRATQAARTLRATLHDELLLGTAHTSITQEDLELQRYRLQPSNETRDSFLTAADTVTSALFDAQSSATARGRADARRLAGSQSDYRRQADPLIKATTAATTAPTTADQVANEQIATRVAYQSLVQDMDGVLAAYSARAQDEAVALYDANVRLLAGVVIALLLGAGLAAMGRLARLHLDHAWGEPEPASDQRVDPLTELPDEIAFLDLVQGALVEARDSGGRGVTVLAIGLNGFEATERAHGRDGCDQLVVAAGRRLRRLLRDVDVVARIGENEFGVLLREMTNRPDVRAVTDRIDQVIGRDFRLQTGMTSVSASIGVAFGLPGGDPEAVLREANAAMYRVRPLDDDPDPVAGIHLAVGIQLTAGTPLTAEDAPARA
jgi:diguanylate cyclase (GGDEF)-like protein